MKSKGNLLVGQSGGSTAVINCSLVGVVREAARHAAIGHVWGMRHGSRGLLAEDFADLRRLSKATLDGLLRTPSSALGSCRHKLSEDDLGRAVAVLRKHDVRFLFYIGGNDSAETLLRISHRAWLEGYALSAILVPKTIDNDLPCTDHCPGYGSVARFVAATTQETGRDTESMRHQDPVKIIEVMGRNSGWIAA
ncbi:MAG: 6-phosphofructokinase, partial [Planctomycetes bacterium]|nr:6-phosphofructokinase [Planctomycetota bacterium]